MNELIKTIVTFIILFFFIGFFIWLGTEEPHQVEIEGKKYIRMKEWNGSHYQIILLPVDSTNQ